MSQAEDAFTEANRHDYLNPTVWGWLALTSLVRHLHRIFGETWNKSKNGKKKNSNLQQQPPPITSAKPTTAVPVAAEHAIRSLRVEQPQKSVMHALKCPLSLPAICRYTLAFKMLLNGPGKRIVSWLQEQEREDVAVQALDQAYQHNLTDPELLSKVRSTAATCLVWRPLENASFNCSILYSAHEDFASGLLAVFLWNASVHCLKRIYPCRPWKHTQHSRLGRCSSNCVCFLICRLSTEFCAHFCNFFANGKCF